MIVTFVLAVVKDEHVCHRTPKRAGPEITRLGDAQQQHLAGWTAMPSFVAASQRRCKALPLSKNA